MITVPSWWERDVSRETLGRLNEYANLIRKWTPRINLVAKSTLEDLEARHIWDSAQVYDTRRGCWADFGSGGGLPGVVVAILALGEDVPTEVTLVESDQRKATFLRTCARELDVPLRVIAKRIEDTPTLDAKTVSARALAPLNSLLDLASVHLAENGMCIFQKGAQWRDEIVVAQQNWRFSYEAMQSKTNSEAVVLKIKDMTRV